MGEFFVVVIAQGTDGASISTHKGIYKKKENKEAGKGFTDVTKRRILKM